MHGSTKHAWGVPSALVHSSDADGACDPMLVPDLWGPCMYAGPLGLGGAHVRARDRWELAEPLRAHLHRVRRRCPRLGLDFPYLFALTVFCVAPHTRSSCNAVLPQGATVDDWYSQSDVMAGAPGEQMAIALT